MTATAAELPSSGRGRRWLRCAVDAGALAVALGFTASYFPTSLLLSPTTPNGGDTSSHYYAAVYLRDVLLPRGELMGWIPGNYAGHPLFQFYFPLAFLLMAALGALMPMAVAFKLVTVLGTLLLPPCAFLSLRLMGTPFPGPALGALATLPFLFMEANSMWGGNIPSLLAGEFTFSLGFALSVLFLGTLRRTMATGRGRVGNALLVATMGLLHGYPLLWAGLVSTLELVTTRGFWWRLGTLVRIHGTAILLMAFWLLPLLYYAPWTTAFNVSWIHNSWREVLPTILWPAALLAPASAIGVAAACWRRKEPYPRELGILWGAILVSVLFWATAYSFHVVDVRFLPFLQVGLCLAAAAGLGRLLSTLPTPELWPLVAALALPPFVHSQVSFIPSWIRWNYSGFEAKGSWPILHELSEYLRGSFRDPRVAYEHSSENEAFGTVRVFESLPLFSGRSTLEGLYMQSSTTPPFVFYLQSEISKEISCPLPDWGCTRVDLDRGTDHLRMFNVSQLILRSDELKGAAARHPGLAREASFGPYEVYRVAGNDGRYAVPLESAPVLIRARDRQTWKQAAYQWFKRAAPGDPVPVFAEDASAEEEAVFAAAFDEPPRELPREILADPPRLTERFETNRLTITGCRPGHPVLVRISYHPRWRAVTGERIWLAAPSFMLVFPRSERVEIAFQAGPVLGAGRVCASLGLALVLLSLLPAGRRVASRAQERLGSAGPIGAVVKLVRRSAAWSQRTRRWTLVGSLAVLAAALAAFVSTSSVSNADAIYRKGVEIFADGRLRESLPYFEEAERLSPLSSTSYHARYFTAIVHFREEDWREAERRFALIVANFPEAPNAPEALYHLGLCRSHLGNTQGAADAWRELKSRFPDTEWARFADDRLAEAAVHSG